MTLGLVLHLVVWHAYHGAEESAFEHATLAFETANPGVSVELVAVPFGAYSYKLEAAIPHGNGPDLFVGKSNGLQEWIDRGLIDAIDAEVDPSQFVSGTLPPLIHHQRLYGVPLAFKSVALFYRRDRITKPPRTTDELVAIAEREHAADRCGLAYEAASLSYHAAWLHGFGGRILDDNNQPALDSAEAARSIEFVRMLANRHLIAEEATGQLVTDLFNRGECAMAISGPWFLSDIEADVRFGVASLPIVSSTGKPAAPLSEIEALMLPARSKTHAAALNFALFLSGKDAARLRALEGRQTVATAATWQLDEIKNDPVLTAFYDQFKLAVPMSQSRALQASWEPGQRALRRVLRGDVDAKRALAGAQAEIVATLRPAPPPAAKLPFAISLFALGLALLWWRQRAQPEVAFRSQPVAYVYLAPAAVAMGVLVFVPFVVGAAMSLFDYDGVHATFVGWGNFGNILRARDTSLFSPLSFYFALLVTALWTVANVALHVAIGVALALLLRSPLLRLRGVYRALLIVPWAVPNYITALIWKGLFHKQFGAINALLKVCHLEPISWFAHFWTAFAANLATNVWLGFPFMMVVTLGALSRIPRELEEAAALDGASAWMRLRHIVLPLIRPALLPAVLIGAVWTFNMFNVVFLVSGGEPDGSTDILVSQAYRWAFQRGHQYGYAAAYAVLIFLLLVAQTAFGRRMSQKQAT